MNGEEITISELETEAAATGTSVKDAAGRNAVLDAVVQRHLLSAAAKGRGLDKDPSFLSFSRRAEQSILAQMFMAASRNVEEPTVAEARTFILRNPPLFDARQTLVLEQIGFSPRNRLKPAEVEAVKSLEDAERLLLARGGHFSRRRIAMDPADVPAALLPKLLDIPLGETFYTTQGNTGNFGVVVERKAEPVPLEAQIPRAKSILRKAKVEQAVQSAEAGLRRSAKIVYGKGFAAPAPARPGTGP